MVRSTVACCALSLLGVLAACSGSSPSEPTGAADPGGGVPTASASPTVGVAPAPDAPQTYEDAQRSAARLMLKRAELPGDIWTGGGEVPQDDFPAIVCGVNNEPKAPAGAFVGHWVATGGPVLLQDVRPVGATQASSVLAELGAAVRSCGTDQRRNADGTSTAWQVSQVQVGVPEVVAFRENRPGETIYRFRAYFAQADSLIAFTTLSSSPDKPDNFFEYLVSKVRTKA